MIADWCCENRHASLAFNHLLNRHCQTQRLRETLGNPNIRTLKSFGIGSLSEYWLHLEVYLSNNISRILAQKATARYDIAVVSNPTCLSHSCPNITEENQCTGRPSRTRLCTRHGPLVNCTVLSRPQGFIST